MTSSSGATPPHPERPWLLDWAEDQLVWALEQIREAQIHLEELLEAIPDWEEEQSFTRRDLAGLADSSPTIRKKLRALRDATGSAEFSVGDVRLWLEQVDGLCHL